MATNKGLLTRLAAVPLLMLLVGALLGAAGTISGRLVAEGWGALALLIVGGAVCVAVVAALRALDVIDRL